MSNTILLYLLIKGKFILKGVYNFALLCYNIKCYIIAFERQYLRNGRFLWKS